MRRDRAAVCAAVVLLHAGICFVLVRTTLHLRIELEPPALLLLTPLPITPEMPDAPAAHPGRGRRQPSQTAASRSRPGASAPAPEPITAPALPPPPDWAAEAARAADDQVQAQMTRERQAGAFTPHGAPLAGPEPQAPAFHWDQSAIHRVQPAGGGLTILHVNEQCGVVFFLVVPFMGGCALGKAEARSDLFNHMHDPPKMGGSDEGQKQP